MIGLLGDIVEERAVVNSPEYDSYYKVALLISINNNDHKLITHTKSKQQSHRYKKRTLN